MTAGRAPRPVSSRCRRSSSVPWVVAVGVRYQVAPSKRSSRACSTPAASEPASGWPPTKRGSAAAPITVRLVEPTSVTTQVRGACASTVSTVSARTSTGTATKAGVGAVERVAQVAVGRVDRAAGHGLVGPRVEPADRGAEPRAGGQSDRAPDQPDADDGDESSPDEGGLARDGGRGLHTRGVGGEALGAQRLRTVADGLLGVGMDLDDDAVGPDRGGGEAERLDEVAPPRGMARVDDDRQVGLAP